MKLRLIAIGSRPPRWVRDAYDDYTRRLGTSLKPVLLEIEPGLRTTGGAASRAIAAEGRRVLGALKPGEFVVALDEHGAQMTSPQLAHWLAGRMRSGSNLAFVVGGPDGLAPEVLARSDLTLSLSRLTLPHALVRVLLAEQLYRAQSLLMRHPYHRS